MDIVQMNQISHQFGKTTIIKDVNLVIEEGEIFGLLGPSGAGKTTLVKMMTGVLSPSKGDVFLNGEKMPSLNQMKQYGFMAQSDALYQELTARENLDFFASLYKMPKARKKERIKEVMDMVDLTDHLDKTVETFSGGMKRRLSLAAALVHEPKLIILDEPTVGIDPVLRQSIWDELNRLKSDGVTIIVTTHVMDEAEKCDRLAMLRSGKVIALNSPQLLKEGIGARTLEEVFLYYGGGDK
ncbi:ABC transporter ATP-binding protein [Halobacillus sp. BBL2006]|uniref:ABC transporter ATP-binding protein n=1 Tax=Halobacillus sp. BBL2006 TaxID=1543706 RepID=UPI0005427C79|nr:ABC transporter ATP-binding protein [Halobacillus sp. BBL2006]KHE72696.1 ABC transporter ATP-binding protein [Halobacillus sp. BBL2006]